MSAASTYTSAAASNIKENAQNVYEKNYHG